MNGEPQIQALEHRVKELISAEPDLFLVDLRIKPTNNIKVFIDGDNGVPIEKLVMYNRALYRQIEAANLYPNGDFSLEVSSPGLDEPLKLHRQYQKNVGRHVEIVLNDGGKTEGKLLSVNEAGIVVEEEKGKKNKKEYIQHVVSFEQIKSTKIQIKF